MYSEYFGLRESPFSIAPDPHYFYISNGHREALAHLLYGINSEGGFVLLTGEVGTGKTTVCRCLLQQMPDNCEIAFILNPKLSSVELLASICDEFKIPYPKGNETIKELVARINDFLITASQEGKRAVLIIEEAQNLSVDVLEQIRLLTNLETNQRKLLQIIMLGQPELRETLSKPELRQLSQRITARYHLGPLAREEVAAYVNHRLSVAGLVRGELFPPPVVKMLYRLTGGVPRLINVLSDRALLGAYTQGKARVDKNTLSTAAHEVSGTSNRGQQQRRRCTQGAIALAVVLLLAGMWYYAQMRGVSSRANTRAASPQSTPAVSEPKEEVVGIVGSRDAAYRTLFMAWAISYDPNDMRTACEQAQSHNLRCHEGKGDLDAVRTINKPIMLRLIDAQGKDYYLTITSLHGNNVVYSINGEIKAGNINDTIQGWMGDYQLLWSLPNEFVDTLKPGDRGPFVSWLDGQLAVIDKRKRRSKPKNTYDEDMVKRVKAFQSSAGLKSDGYVGPTTIGRLIMKTGTVGPALNDTKGG